MQAEQRAGRAGRTRAGTCYRLYSARYHERQMAAATPPEILRTSLLAAVLQLKSLPLQVDVLEFDFLDRPTVPAPLSRSVLSLLKQSRFRLMI